MGEFTIRVELHNANAGDYRLVHQKLHSQGFTHLMTDGQDMQYEMPHAEYSYKADLSDGDVLNQVKNAISESIKTTFSILVTRSAGRAAYGLQQADGNTPLG